MTTLVSKCKNDICFAGCVKSYIREYMEEIIWSTIKYNITYGSKVLPKWGFTILICVNYICAKNPKSILSENMTSWLSTTCGFLTSFMWFRVKPRVTSRFIPFVNSILHVSGFLKRKSFCSYFIFKIGKFSYKGKCGHSVWSCSKMRSFVHPISLPDCLLPLPNSSPIVTFNLSLFVLSGF